MSKRIITAMALAAATAAPAFAQDFGGQIKARQGEMALLGVNLGVVGDMAQGKAEWDADMAAAAAGNLVAISMIDQSVLLPEGSDSFELSDQTRAKPEIWDNFADYEAKWSAFGEAAKELQTAAAAGPDGLGAAVGKVGQSCKGCHEDYRAPKD